MSVEVIDPGLFTSIQDFGRNGYQKNGVSVGGVMDSYATKVANLLVGNRPDAAVLEITLKGPKLKVNTTKVLSISGGDLCAKINGMPISLNRPFVARAGSVLEFGYAKTGCRCYLAAAGGWKVPKILGSRSTNFKAGFGGYEGRTLGTGDILKNHTLGVKNQTLKRFLKEKAGENLHTSTTWYVPEKIWECPTEKIVRVIRGENFEDFTKGSQEAFFSQEFTVTPQSDRMGCRLLGPTLQLKKPLEMISAPVPVGTVQVPPSGEPIALMADCQTVGGYPKIVHVITNDLPVFAQRKPGDTIVFQEVSLKEAQEMIVDREKRFKQMKAVINTAIGV